MAQTIRSYTLVKEGLEKLFAGSSSNHQNPVRLVPHEGKQVVPISLVSKLQDGLGNHKYQVYVSTKLHEGLPETILVIDTNSSFPNPTDYREVDTRFEIIATSLRLPYKPADGFIDLNSRRL